MAKEKIEEIIEDISNLLNDTDIPEKENLKIIEYIVGIDYLVEIMWERVGEIKDEDEANSILIYLQKLKKKYAK